MTICNKTKLTKKIFDSNIRPNLNQFGWGWIEYNLNTNFCTQLYLIVISSTMNILASRLPALRFLALAGMIQLGLTISSNIQGMPMMSISEYMEGEVKSRSPFIITGVLKPRSIKVGKGLEKKFKITDNTYDIQCTYNGMSKTEFKQGQLLVLESYCPDIMKKQNIIIKEYLTKHSMEANEWEKKRAVDKQSYGLEGTYR